MTYTIQFADNNIQSVALLNYLKTLDFVTIKEQSLSQRAMNPREEYQTMMKHLSPEERKQAAHIEDAIREVYDIRAGRAAAVPFGDFLDTLDDED